MKNTRETEKRKHDRLLPTRRRSCPDTSDEAPSEDVATCPVAVSELSIRRFIGLTKSSACASFGRKRLAVFSADGGNVPSETRYLSRYTTVTEGCPESSGLP